MLNKIIPVLISIATSITYLASSTPPKSHYHSLFISSSFSHSSNESISDHLYILTRRPHVAGTEANEEAAAYVLSTLSSYNIKSHIASYDVSLTYPISRSLILTIDPSGSTVEFEFELKQEVYEGDPYADVADQVLPTFHGYAASGNAAGRVVYANYGRVEDLQTLERMGVNVSGTVVLARYGQIFRGDIVRNAYEAGAIGVLIFTDKKDYGGGGGVDAKWFPDDKWMPPSGVQVGSVYTGVGDPTTPGWSSSGGCERLSDDEVKAGGDVPLIPSLPISGADGEAIIRAIGGAKADDDWQGGEDAPVYRVGPGPAVVNLSYTGEQVIRTIHNVIGVIEGAEEPDRYVILGNHRDAWTFGAVDPNSGTAALLEVAERLARLQEKGWRPRRTIILCNWDAEEYGLVGSTEWVEENREMLTSRAVAYFNVDCAVTGGSFQASATPQLDELIMQATQQVKDPDNSSQTVYDSWVSSIKNAAVNNSNNSSKSVTESWFSSGYSPQYGRLGGGGSDYAAFVQHIGVPAADVSFGGGYPVYHSMYDDFIWMKKFGDPTFRRHAAVASIWGLVALHLADDVFLPFNYVSYANELQNSAEDLEVEVSGKSITLVPLFKSIEELQKAAININNEIKALQENKGWTLLQKSDAWKVREVNDRLMMAERAFTDREGLSGRPWHKHMIYAPSGHNDYGSNCFPGIYDAIEETKSSGAADSWRFVQHEVWRVARAIKHASLVLSGELT